ncbi:hypothetical protein AB0P05_45215 [Streptomyces flaveolus]|uniref:DinB/UmuC family translesion DNA polymerase n=1 Tax=Streptomyces flaveolus TaxID=67297 RepID=UPI003425BCEA
MLDLVVQLGLQLRHRGQAARALTLTLRFAGGTTWEKARRLPEPSAHEDDLRTLAYQLMDAAGLQRALRGAAGPVPAVRVAGAWGLHGPWRHRRRTAVLVARPPYATAPARSARRAGSGRRTPPVSPAGRARRPGATRAAPTPAVLTRRR